MALVLLSTGGFRRSPAYVGATAEAMVETEVFMVGEKEMSFPLCTYGGHSLEASSPEGLAQVGIIHLQ